MDTNKETVQKKRCLIPLNIKHKCTYTEDGEASLNFVANAICYLNTEVASCKLMLRKIDKNLESFMETVPETPKRLEINKSSILDEFPLKNLDDLHAMEKKLKQDTTFQSEVVNALHLHISGDSDKKQVTSILRAVLDDNLASFFNWKGQRGTKQKMSTRRIATTMIGKIYCIIS
ncbi:uncharacterized protein LOC118647094 [Monomorium pharaonis]|uniref:uncharacterized protein LOC118647094 n=1 Tax=Monomorium pharaonis TaxID=307658 RepID=UPI001745F997|nr:uncharacterized protein LOC118647094 [Monomorium pharaonis]